MKHYLLPALLWALAISSIFAQRTLSPSAQQQASNWPRSVKKMMRSAGYDLEAALAPPTVQLRSNPLRLDSTKTFFGYEANGGQDSTPQYRTIYQYLATGQKISTEFEFSGSTWTPTTQTIESSDALGRVTHSLTKTYDPTSESWVPDSRVQVFPHGNSMALADSFQIFGWDPTVGAWLLSFQSKNTFNAQDRLLKTETTFDFDGQPGLLTDNYSYDANGDNHLVESSIVVGGFSIPASKRDMTYANHRLIQVIQSASNGFGGGFTPSTRTTLAYNAAHLVKQTNHYDWAPGVNDWEPTQTIVQEYDSQLRRSVTETETFFVGQPSEKERVTNAYVEEENLALVATYAWGASLNQYTLAEREYYYYAGGSSSVKPTPRMAQALILSPNPTDGELRFPMEAEAEVRVFDAAGQLLQSRIVQPGEALNLTALPTGMYQVTARSGAGFYAGKVLKE